jgi:hypothetical protein
LRKDINDFSLTDVHEGAVSIPPSAEAPVQGSLQMQAALAEKMSLMVSKRRDLERLYVAVDCHNPEKVTTPRAFSTTS